MKKITNGKEQPPVGKAVKDTDVQKSVQALAGIYNPNLQIEARKLQEDAATTVLMGLGVPQFNQASINVTDPNSSLAMKLDNKTYPGQMLRKQPTKMVQGFQPGKIDPNAQDPNR